MRESKDPTVFTVLFEDTAAMLGLIVAFVALGLGQLTDIQEFDAIGSLMIGLILAVTAALLAYESKGLLIGESASTTVTEGIRRLAAAEPGVARVNELLTMHMAPQQILLNISLDFENHLTADEVEAVVSKLEARIRAQEPEGHPGLHRGPELGRPHAPRRRRCGCPGRIGREGGGGVGGTKMGTVY